MSEFRFHHPIEVRYGDLDPQGHVNNARYLTYLEQARIQYIGRLDLWPGGSFLELGVILAEIRLTFLAPIQFGQAVQVGVRVTRLGNKSLTMEHVIEDANTGQQMATGTAVLVTYDYHANRSMPLPEEWRRKMADFEGLDSER